MGIYDVAWQRRIAVAILAVLAAAGCGMTVRRASPGVQLDAFKYVYVAPLRTTYEREFREGVESAVIRGLSESGRISVIDKDTYYALPDPDRKAALTCEIKLAGQFWRTILFFTDWEDRFVARADSTGLWSESFTASAVRAVQAFLSEYPGYNPAHGPAGLNADAAAADPAEQRLVSGRRQVLALGIGSFADAGLPPLLTAAADARSFGDWCLAPEGGGVPAEDVQILTDRAATRQAILDALNVWMARTLPDDLVILFIAGRVEPARLEQPRDLYLLPFDARPGDYILSGIALWEIEAALDRLIPARRVVIIADIAQDVSLPGMQEVMDLQVRHANDALHLLSRLHNGICVITAASDSGSARNPENPADGPGIFTGVLVKGLGGEADTDRDQAVTLGELVPYLCEQVRALTGGAQSPVVTGRYQPGLAIGSRSAAERFDEMGWGE